VKEDLSRDQKFERHAPRSCLQASYRKEKKSKQMIRKKRITIFPSLHF
jgi:hypothetical protein